MKARILGATALLLTFLAPGTAAARSYADDRAEIENLAARYAIAMDARDLDTYVSTFAEDGEFVWYRGTARGRQAIRDAIGGWITTPAVAPDATSQPRIRHVILNHVIDVEGDRANEKAYWVAFTNNTPQKDVQVMYFGHYESELKYTGGKWLYTKRTIFNESMENRKLFYPSLGEKDPRK
jgi:3-phenylpropionate/cinnamic acid dioxygenase small subunit